MVSLVFTTLGLKVEVFGRVQKSAQVFYSCQKEAWSSRACLPGSRPSSDIELVDSLQQTPLFYAAREGNVAVARMLISLGMTINFVDNRGSTALDYAVVHDRLEMVTLVRLLTSMGAQINSVSLSKSQAMEALLREVREKRGAHRESRKRKRDVHSSACPSGMRRSATVSWTYSDTEAEEPEILPDDVTVIHENDQFLACTFPEKYSTTAKRIRRSAPRPQEKYMDMSSVCARDKSGLCKWVLLSMLLSTSILAF